MATATRADIKSVFTKLTKDEFLQDEVLETLYELSLEMGINPHDLGNKWESFALNRQLSVKPSMASLRAFKQRMWLFSV